MAKKKNSSPPNNCKNCIRLNYIQKGDKPEYFCSVFGDQFKNTKCVKKISFNKKG